MIKRNGSFRRDLRQEMRGGDGEILIQHIWEPGTELRSNTRMFAKLTINPGCSIGKHVHDQEEEIFYILSGTAEFSDNGTPVVLNPGDSARTGGGEAHSIRNIGTEPVELIAFIGRF